MLATIVLLQHVRALLMFACPCLLTGTAPRALGSALTPAPLRPCPSLPLTSVPEAPEHPHDGAASPTGERLENGDASPASGSGNGSSAFASGSGSGSESPGRTGRLAPVQRVPPPQAAAWTLGGAAPAGGGGNPILDPDQSSPYAVFAAAAAAPRANRGTGSTQNGPQPVTATGRAGPAAPQNGAVGAVPPEYNGAANPYGRYAV
jgi:hypothetical protein